MYCCSDALKSRLLSETYIDLSKRSYGTMMSLFYFAYCLKSERVGLLLIVYPSRG